MDLLLAVITLCFFWTPRPVAAWDASCSRSSFDGDLPLQENAQLTVTSPPQPQRVLYPVGHGQCPAAAGSDGASNDAAPLDVLAELHQALHVMQNTWFQLWLGTWPTSIDWTAAVLNTHLVATLNTYSKATAGVNRSQDELQIEALESKSSFYFDQVTAFYFNENAFSLRNQAYDDMSWVVLSWLESINFITSRNRTLNHPWHGAQFTSVFAHRAHIFHQLIQRGWDISYCNGGMLWRPDGGPYKNAITNQLYIAANVGIYLYHPGDSNEFPFSRPSCPPSAVVPLALEPAIPHDPAKLRRAVEGYDWLKHSNMTNKLGLYVDGYHVPNWKANGTKCENRNEQVFTYNQGVLLSGLRQLWEAKGDATYLEDGHKLVRNVIAATGWNLERQGVVGNREDKGRWQGLGRNGVLEDLCDSRGKCDQNAQTFKGIYFHHLALFCQPLPVETALVPGVTFTADAELESLHWSSCSGYRGWVRHNTHAALATTDAEGRFGQWWGAGWYEVGEVELPPLVGGAVDRFSEPWSLEKESRSSGKGAETEVVAAAGPGPKLGRMLRNRGAEHRGCESGKNGCDPNEQWRGRTVESHSGGLAVLRCLWELERLG